MPRASATVRARMHFVYTDAGELRIVVEYSAAEQLLALTVIDPRDFEDD